jgi:hypothetical protein
VLRPADAACDRRAVLQARVLRHNRLGPHHGAPIARGRPLSESTLISSSPSTSCRPHCLADPALRALLHRGRQPWRPPRRLHSPSDRSLAGTAGSQPDLEAPRGRARPSSCSANGESKFAADFDHVFRSEGVRVLRTPSGSPRANSGRGAPGGDRPRECVEHRLIFSRGHLDRVLVEFIEHYRELGRIKASTSDRPARRPTHHSAGVAAIL